MEEHDANSTYDNLPGMHYHMYVKLATKINITTAKFFDFALGEDENGGPFYHCNIQSGRNEKSILQYVKKDGVYEAEGIAVPVWGRMMDPTLTVKQALDLLIKEEPRSALIYGQQITANLKEFKQVQSVYTPPVQHYEPLPSMVSWLSTEFKRKERAKCLVLVGPTRIGKTSWARSLGPHMFFRANFNLSKWDPNAKYIVFDDIPWTFIPHKKSLLTQMGECDLTDKYKGKKTVMVTMPAIVCVNEDGIAGPGDPRNDPYWQENCTFVDVNRKLY